MLHRRALAVLLSVATLGTAGCGGDGEEKNRYVNEVQSAQRAYLQRFEAVRTGLTPKSTLAEDRATLTAFDEATTTFIGALREAEPPEGVEEEHGKLIAAVEGYAEELGGAGETIGEGTTEERTEARAQLAASVRRAQGAITDAVSAVNDGLRE